MDVHIHNYEYDVYNFPYPHHLDKLFSIRTFFDQNAHFRIRQISHHLDEILKFSIKSIIEKNLRFQNVY